MSFIMILQLLIVLGALGVGSRSGIISLVVSPLSPKRAHNRDKDNVFFLNSCFLFKKNQSTLKIIPQTSHFVNSS